MATSDEIRALIVEAQDGNVRAFELLVATHLGQVRRFARAFASTPADADDLAQDALVKVYKSLRSFQFQASFATWLYAVIRNVFLDAARSRAGKERALEDPLPAGHEQVPAELAPPDVALTQAEDRARLWAALQQVPSEFRTALVLFDIEGHSYEEVAEIEGVAIGTVKSRLSRGRAALRKALEARPVASGASEPDIGGTKMRAVSSHERRSLK